MRRTTFVLALFLSALASAAGAQTPQSLRTQLFAGAGIDSDPYTYAPDRDTAATLVAGIGKELPHRWRIRYELTVPMWHELSNVNQCLCWTGNIPVDTESTDRHRMTTHVGLVGYEIPIGARVGLMPVAGAGLIVHTDREHSRITSLFGEVLSDRDSSDLTFHAAIVAGADVAVRVTDRFALVPQVRLYGIPESESAQPIVRPALLARFRF
jgi:hypothetical protein